jgi:hypothetical protein
MNRFPLLLLVVGMLAAPCFAQASLEDRVKALEAENRRLAEELRAARQRLQELESGSRAQGAPSTKTTDDSGPDNFGNPLAIRRTLTQMLREHLAARKITVPDAASDPRTVQAYRNGLEAAIKDFTRLRRLQQPITWTIEIIDAVVVSDSSVLEYLIHAYSLNAEGARVGPYYPIRVPASAVPKFKPLDGSGVWVLKGEVIPELAVVTSQPATTNVFKQRETLLPDLECSLRFRASSLERAVQTQAPTR